MLFFLYGLSSLEYWYYQREHARFNYAFLFFSNFLIGILSFCFELQFNNQFLVRCINGYFRIVNLLVLNSKNHVQHNQAKLASNFLVTAIVYGCDVYAYQTLSIKRVTPFTIMSTAIVPINKAANLPTISK